MHGNTPAYKHQHADVTITLSVHLWKEEKRWQEQIKGEVFFSVRKNNKMTILYALLPGRVSSFSVTINMLNDVNYAVHDAQSAIILLAMRLWGRATKTPRTSHPDDIHCTLMNQIWFWQKLPLSKKTEGWELAEIGAWGGGERGMAITGSDEGETVHYWQRCPLWARQRRIHRERNDMKEGQSEWKRSQPTTWKPSEVDTFVFYAFPHLQIFHVLRRLSPCVFDVILFIYY